MHARRCSCQRDRKRGVCYFHLRAGPNTSSGLSTFRRLASLESESPKTAPSFVGFAFLGFATACSRRARCNSTRLARSGSRHFCNFLRKGFIDLTISGLGTLAAEHGEKKKKKTLAVNARLPFPNTLSFFQAAPFPTWLGSSLGSSGFFRGDRYA